MYSASKKGGVLMNHPATFEMSTTDSLTGLLSAVYFRHLLRESLLPAAEERGEPLTVGLLDVDGFLGVNETYGMEAGDELLKGLARTLQGLLPDSAAISRYSGDEIAFALPDTRLDDAFSLLEEFRRRMATLRFSPWPDLQVTCSVGLAAYPGNGRNDVELMREADQALYVAKVTGRNKVALPLADARMITKTSHYTQTQLERLAALARTVKRNEATLLREALDDLLKKYNDLLGGPPRSESV
jgi:diguanylate cyclase (GGDEF)-like protein